MALKQLMITKKIEQRKSSLTELLAQDVTLKTREAELETALEEAKTDEEIALVEENSTKLEADKADVDEKKSKLEGEIADLEGELEQLNSKEPKGDPKLPEQKKSDSRGEGMMKRYKIFKEMTREAVETLIAREDVKEFLTRTREFGSQTRSVQAQTY